MGLRTHIELERGCSTPLPPAPQELDATLAGAEAKAAAYEGKHCQAVAAVDALRASVWDMFNRIG